MSRAWLGGDLDKSGNSAIAGRLLEACKLIGCAYHCKSILSIVGRGRSPVVAERGEKRKKGPS